MRAASLAAALIGVSGLAGCISSAGETPAWFSERQAMEEGGYPSLRDVPRTTIANTDAEHWQEVQADLLAAGQEVKSHPRAQPATEQEDPAAFIEEARRDLEQARAAHEPN
jgi:hypothetical protein